MFVSHRRTTARAAATATLLVFAPAATAQGQHAQDYAVTRVPSSADAADAFHVWGLGGMLNNAGQIAGYGAPNAGRMQALLTGPDGKAPLAQVGRLPSEGSGLSTYGLAVSDDGRVTGFGGTAVGDHAFYWDGIALRDLGTLGGRISLGYDVNSSGRVAGEAYNAGGQSHAFVSAPNGGALTDLGTLGGTHSFAFGISDAGRVVGYANTARHVPLAVYWDPTAGGYSAATTISGLGTAGSFAYGVSDGGSVTGHTQVAGGPRAFYWSGLPDQDATIIGVFADLANVNAFGYGVSSGGQVVGFQEGVVGGVSVSRGFLWDHVHGLRDLSSVASGWTIVTARGINDAGQILAYGQEQSTQTNSWVLLTPDAPSAAVPEPGTWALLGTGLLALGGVARQRQHARA
jgi:probable HAF family extracellular repeat protein